MAKPGALSAGRPADWGKFVVAMRLRFRPWAIAGVAVAIVAGAVATDPAAADPPPPSYRLRIVNNTAVEDQHVFVSLTGGSVTPTTPDGLSMNQVYPLSVSLPATTPWTHEGGHTYSVILSGPWTSGTILYSIGGPSDPFRGYATQPTVGLNDHQYDLSELTFDSSNTFNGDISAVNQIGIPARLSILKPDGTIANRNGSSSPATEYVGCVDATRRVMEQSLTGWDPASSGVWRTKPNGDFLQLEGLGSAAIYPNYPSFEGYVKSLAGQTLTVRGYYAGGANAGNPAYYSYSGEVADDGSVFLTGTLSDSYDGTGTSNYPTPAGIYIAGSEIYGHNPVAWPAGTGYGVYAQDAPYIVGNSVDATFNSGSWTGTATQPPATAGAFINSASTGWTAGQHGAYKNVGNDVYGWIYGDFVVSYAMGYWGGNSTGQALYNSYRWNTNRPVNADNPPAGLPWWTAAGLPAYHNAWTGPVPDHARYNLYQNATQTTGTTYGMALGDRFAPEGSLSPEIGVSNTADGTGFHGTWQVELLAANGCATASAMSPASGPAGGGTDVTITGRNLHEGATVAFDGVAATNVQVSTDPVTGISTVTGTAPAHAEGTVQVQVTNPYGQRQPAIDSAEVPSGFTYTGAGGPSGGGDTPGPSASVTTVKVNKPLRGDPGRAPSARIAVNKPTSLAVRGLPRSRLFSAAVRVGRHWQALGRLRSTKRGAAVLPTLSVDQSGRSLVRLSAGRRLNFYLRLMVSG